MWSAAAPTYEAARGRTAAAEPVKAAHGCRAFFMPAGRLVLSGWRGGFRRGPLRTLDALLRPRAISPNFRSRRAWLGPALAAQDVEVDIDPGARG